MIQDVKYEHQVKYLIDLMFFGDSRCVALAPPCVFSINGARASSPFITSVVIGDDMVSRLSLSSSYDLRNATVRLHNEVRSAHHNDILCYIHHP